MEAIPYDKETNLRGGCPLQVNIGLRAMPRHVCSSPDTDYRADFA